MNPESRPNLFPSFDSIEAVLWPAAALAVFVITAVLVDLMVILAARWRLVDLPNRRSAHALPTARGGGLAIVLTTTLASILVVLRWPPATLQIMLGVCLPCLVIAAMGIVDDIQPTRPIVRLAIQVGVAVAIVAAIGPLERITVPGLPTFELGWAGWPLTVTWIVGMINAFNFMDGSDGMAALGAVVAGCVMALIGWQLRMHLPLLLAAFAAAAAGGFLVFNWQPARVFMGDVGSSFLGAYLATVPLTFPEPYRAVVIVPVTLVLLPYILDPLVSVLRRVWHGHNPFVPHREFFFHRLIRSGVSHGQTAAVYAVLAALGGLAAVVMVDDAVADFFRSLLPVVVLLLTAGLAFAIERRCTAVGLAAPEQANVAEAGDAAAPQGIYPRLVKRGFDIVAAAVLIVLVAPLMACVAVAVRLVLGSPVLHRDLRAGRDGRPFEVVKFRSMREATGPDGRPLPDAERLGWFGAVLRRTSLDELPQLLSVLGGEMSMVGPRPLPIRYIPRYSPRQATRLLVRPGLTGWAQIHGRNAVDWPRRLEYDAEYVEILRRWHAPLADLWIVAATLFQLVVQALTGRGVAAPGSVTMEEFQP